LVASGHHDKIAPVALQVHCLQHHRELNFQSQPDFLKEGLLSLWQQPLLLSMSSSLQEEG